MMNKEGWSVEGKWIWWELEKEESGEGWKSDWIGGTRKRKHHWRTERIPLKPSPPSSYILHSLDSTVWITLSEMRWVVHRDSNDKVRREGTSNDEKEGLCDRQLKSKQVCHRTDVTHAVYHFSALPTKAVFNRSHNIRAFHLILRCYYYSPDLFSDEMTKEIFDRI